jgi:hypothetical protein
LTLAGKRITAGGVSAAFLVTSFGGLSRLPWHLTTPRYFDAGQFYFPVSGFTHMENEKNNVTWSAYR